MDFIEKSQVKNTAKIFDEKIFKVLFISGIAGIILSISVLYFFYNLSTNSLSRVHSELFPLQKSMSNLKLNSNAILSDLQVMLFFESNNDQSIKLFQISKEQLERNLKELQYLNSKSYLKLKLPELSRNELSALEDQIINEIKNKSVSKARELFYAQKFQDSTQTYLKNVLWAEEVVSSQLIKFKFEQEEQLKFANFFLMIALISNLIIWWRISIEFKNAKNQEELAYKEMEQERIRIIQASKMASLGELSGGIAHEINNPLAIIKASSDILKRQAQMNSLSQESLIKYLDKINATVARISKIITSMRKFARDGSKDDKEVTSLLQLINNSFELSGEKFLSKGIDVIIECPTDIQVMCRPIEIEQVLVNLASNSYDAINECNKAGQHFVKIHVESYEDVVQISFSDSGPGVPEELSNKIFDAFFTTKKSGSGTGLGLAISKRILLEHKGDIWVEHRNNSSAFVIELPIAIANENKKSA